MVCELKSKLGCNENCVKMLYSDNTWRYKIIIEQSCTTSHKTVSMLLRKHSSVTTELMLCGNIKANVFSIGFTHVT